MEQHMIIFNAKKHDNMYAMLLMLNSMKIKVTATTVLQYEKVDTDNVEFLKTRFK